MQNVREQFHVSIRRDKREQELEKLRQVRPQEPVQEDFEEETATPIVARPKMVVLDSRYRDDIVSIISGKYAVDDIPQLVACLTDADVLKRHLGVIGLRKLVSHKSTGPLQKVVEAGVIPLFIELMTQPEYPQIQLESAWVLTNIASGSSRHCEALIDFGAFERFVGLLSSEHTAIVEQAIWAIGNIGGDCARMRDFVLAKGAVQVLLKLAQGDLPAHLLHLAGWAVSNLCRGEPPPRYDLLKPALPFLAGLIQADQLEEDNLIDITCGVHSLCESCNKTKIKDVIETGVIPKVVENCLHSSLRVRAASIRLAGNISTGNELHSNVLFEAGILDVLEEYARDRHACFRKEACWVLSNLAAGSTPQVAQILGRASLMESVAKLFKADTVDIKREIIYIYSNITFGGPPLAVAEVLLQDDVVESFVGLLSGLNPTVISATLTCLGNIWALGEKLRATTASKNPIVKKYLEVPGFIPTFEGLQKMNNRIYEKVVKLMTKFLEVDRVDMND